MLHGLDVWHVKKAPLFSYQPLQMFLWVHSSLPGSPRQLPLIFWSLSCNKISSPVGEISKCPASFQSAWESCGMGEVVRFCLHLLSPFWESLVLLGGRRRRAGKGLLDFLQLYLPVVPCLQVPDSLVEESVVTLEPLLALRLFSLWFSATGHTSSAWSRRVPLAPPVLWEKYSILLVVCFFLFFSQKRALTIYTFIFLVSLLNVIP